MCCTVLCYFFNNSNSISDPDPDLNPKMKSNKAFDPDIASNHGTWWRASGTIGKTVNGITIMITSDKSNDMDSEDDVNYMNKATEAW